MARASKGARHIAVDGVAYRWRVRDIGICVALTVWPAAPSGPMLTAWFDHDASLGREQLIVTNRLVRRVIELAVVEHRYDAQDPRTAVNLPHVNVRIDTTATIRAPRRIDFPHLF
jgi:hypothetical protein